MLDMYRKISIIFIFFYGLAYVVVSISSFIIVGESDMYMLSTISIQNHYSDEVTDDDILIAKNKFPELDDALNRIKNKLFISKNGEIYTAYFPTYSIASLPFLHILNLLDINESRSFALSNSIYYILGLIFIVFRLKSNSFTSLMMVCSLCFSPIIFYIIWPSAEIFICFLLIIFIISIFNKDYKIAALFISLASTLNVTISLLSLLIYFNILNDCDFFNKNYKRNILYNKKNLFNLVQIIILNSLILIPLSLNIVRFGNIVPMQYAGSFNGLFDRFVAYWTDLNFGFLPYFGIYFIIILIALVGSTKRLEFFVTLIMTVIISLAYSINFHINCDGTGLHRYMSWTSTIIIITSIYFSSYILNNNLRKISSFLIILSFIWAGGITYYYGGLKAATNNRNFYVSMGPIASSVLEYYPKAYNPLYSTFNSRIRNVDGGYDLPDKPIYYIASDNSITKILASSKMLSQINSDTCGDKSIIQNSFEINRIGYFYININKNILFLAKCMKLDNNIDINDIIREGWSSVEPFGVWTDGRYAKISIVTEDIPNEIIINGFPFIAPGLPSQRIKIKLNGKDVFSDKLFGAVKIAVPVSYEKNTNSLNPSINKLIIELELPDASRPVDYNMNADRRLLGFGLQSILLK